MINILSSSDNEAELKLTAKKIYQEWINRYRDDYSLANKQRQFGHIEAAMRSGVPTLFYKKGLDSAIAEHLTTIASRYGYATAECRRKLSNNTHNEKQRQLAFIIGLSSILLFNPPSYADNADNHKIISNISSEFSIHNERGSIRIARRQIATEQIIESIDQLKLCKDDHATNRKLCIKPQRKSAEWIRSLFLDRLTQESKQPEIISDLNMVADYYSQFPFIVEILDQLSQHPFTLQASKGHWLAKGSITQKNVKSATVYFDFKSAAQMHFFVDCNGQPQCTASPSDALLHELLHVYLMFTRPEQFINSAKPSGYPHAHEEEVIALERSFYQKMTRIDNLPRPARHRHAAKIVAVECPLCWTGKR